MSNSIQLLVARILMSLIFIPAGFSKLTSAAGTAGYMASLGVPLPSISVWLVIAVELLGGLAILIGFKTRYAAWALAAFCVASGVLAHYVPGDQAQMTNLMKNLAMAGGFLALAAAGAGSYSVDARRT
ncbi:DoxX family protein [Hoeflea sp. YIM 152468]|uniref:DoxX family protein n=1 Tax=Hoeflea sp. YIM 152468 TaxID=3031759 RepID=UPI0023DBC4DA|nr:DoxX family protein [Hoeflea sp. YIM 152468]MDF1606789.1 DoxX family protein [Hoeflea sp. YIM 152468]